MVTLMIKNDFIVKINKSSLILKADPDTLRDISIVLSHLVNMVHLLKYKAQIAEAAAERKLKSRAIKAKQEYRVQSIDIFKSYLAHFNNGCGRDKAKALNKIKEEYQLQAVDAKYYVAEGRRLMKEKGKKQQAVLF